MTRPASINRRPYYAGATMNIKVSYTNLTPSECEDLKKLMIEDHKNEKWGRGENKVPLAELETAHLENILITQRNITNEQAAAILHILKQRYLGSSKPSKSSVWATLE